MALTKSDKEYIKMVNHDLIMSVVGELRKEQQECKDECKTDIHRHELTLFGATGDNGLNGNVRTLKEDSIDQKVFKKEVYAYTAGIAGTVSLMAVIASFIINSIIH